ncbi:hypothetical protein AVEN_154493-1 [Araneus ventricosus]|uniref:Tc1-like transposase DDE domain-containing protein n=1 Tax=Araneus ventricosus TaxID=182803 RepID=A0A4Y2VKB0_ARAVE|nr:hypothetical protein AVEN_154493-1 [Araneus ventricosus]
MIFRKDKTPPHAPVPDAFTATEPVGWTWDDQESRCFEVGCNKVKKSCRFPHAATAMQKLIANFGWEIFPHPPYSPDLAASDFQIFLRL